MHYLAIWARMVTMWMIGFNLRPTPQNNFYCPVKEQKAAEIVAWPFTMMQETVLRVM